MNTPATIIIAILVFGFLILIHELGHYLTARLFKVRIEEFSIGMAQIPEGRHVLRTPQLAAELSLMLIFTVLPAKP